MYRLTHGHKFMSGLFRAIIMGTVAWVILYLALSAAFADGVQVGPDCTFTWVHDPATEATVTSSSLFIGTSPADPGANRTDVGNVTTTTCNAIGLIVPGQYYARVTASNVVGEGNPSNEVPFVLVSTVPGAPSLNVTPITPAGGAGG